MQSIILYDREAIIFWSTKIAATTLAEIILSLQEPAYISNSNKEKDIWPKFSKEIWRPRYRRKAGEDYSRYKKLLFCRNPYHRLISNYLDKYVCSSSPTPEKVPDVANFEQFVDCLYATQLKEENMPTIDHYEFCLQTSGDGWDLLQENSENLFVFTTPPTGLPEARVPMAKESIHLTYYLLGWTPPHVPEWKYSTKAWPKVVNSAYTFSVAQLDALHKNPRSITYTSFYPEHVRKKVYKLYEKDFLYFGSLGYRFKV